MGDKMFSSSFDKFLHLTDLCDFTFVVGGKAFKVHRIVFAAQSAVFSRIFKANQKEAIIEDVKDEIFKEIISYMYTGEIKVTDRNERELLAAGEKFELKEVMNAVHLHRNLRMDPLKTKELESLRMKFEESMYLYKKTKDRYSINNPFSQLPGRYY